MYPTNDARAQVIPLINLNGRFSEANLALHKFASDPALVLYTAFDDDGFTLNEAWTIGNRQGYDPVTKEFWPAWCRSLSVGDLILIRRSGAPEHLYAIESVGFREVPLADAHIDWDGGRNTLANYGHAAYRD